MPTGILDLQRSGYHGVVNFNNDIFLRTGFSWNNYFCHFLCFYVFVFWAPSRVLDKWRVGGGRVAPTPRDHTSVPTRGVLRNWTRGAQGLKTPLKTPRMGLSPLKPPCVRLWFLNHRIVDTAYKIKVCKKYKRKTENGGLAASSSVCLRY